jgi:hypothetical protein
MKQEQAQAMRQQQPQTRPLKRPQPQQRVQRPSVQTQSQSQERVNQRPSVQGRVKKPSQTSQVRGITALEFFHMTGGKAKKLTLSLTIGGGVVLRLSEKEGDVLKSITFALSRTELVSLSREIEFCLMGVRKPTPNDNGRAPIVEFFHMGKNGQYKKLAVEAFEDGGIALTLKQGEKGLYPDGIVFALSRAEAIHLMEELKLLFELTRSYLPVD